MNINIASPLCLISASLLMAACSEEEVVHISDSGSNHILFHASLPALTSRAQIVTADNLPYFLVTAFNPADPLLVTPDGRMNEKALRARKGLCKGDAAAEP